MSGAGAALPQQASRMRAPALVYLYAVLPAGGPAQARLAAGAIHGLADGAPLFPIEAAGLVAAVSLVPAERFDEAPLAELLADLPRLSPLAVRHENAVHALAEATEAIVPVTFGAIYRDTGAVERLLREGAGRFQTALARVRGRQEWGVKLFAEAEALARAAAEGDQLRRLDAEIAAAGPGRAYLLGKSRERALALEAERLGGALAAEIVQRLAPLSVEARLDEAAPAGAAPRLLLKAAFLVENAGADRFLEEAGASERECTARGLTLQCSGPWAPYSFVARPNAAPATSAHDTVPPAMASDQPGTVGAGGVP